MLRERLLRVGVVLAGAALGCGGEEPRSSQLNGVVSVAVGGLHACSILRDGTAACWGSDLFGQLGDGRTARFGESRPVSVAALAGVGALALGPEHSCALLADASVACWGGDVLGQVGGENCSPEVVQPRTVPGIAGRPRSIVASTSWNEYGGYTCALLDDGSAQCWGQKMFPGTTEYAMAPTPVPGLRGATGLALGPFFGCAILGDRRVACWGDGALGQPSLRLNSSATPIPVAGVTDVVALTAGGFHACALSADGSVRCWGDYRGPGSGSDLPTEVPVLTGIEAIAAGGYQTCALRRDGTVLCWGFALPGEPTQITGVAHAITISVGPSHACALIADGTVRCWGDARGGALGDGKPPVLGPAEYSTDATAVVDRDATPR